MSNYNSFGRSVLKLKDDIVGSLAPGQDVVEGRKHTVGQKDKRVEMEHKAIADEQARIRDMNLRLNPNDPRYDAAAVQAETQSTQQSTQDAAEAYRQAIANNQINRGDIRNVEGGAATTQVGLDQANADAMRARMAQQIGNMVDANGNVIYDPTKSAALTQLKYQDERARAAQAGLALAGGMNPALAQRLAAQQTAATSQATAQQAGLISMSEQEAKQRMYNELVGSTRQQDLAQQQNQTQVGIANQAAALADSERALKASLANQGVDLEVVKARAAQGDAAALNILNAATTQIQNDAQRALSASIQNSQVGTQVSMQNADMQKQIDITNIANELTRRGMSQDMVRLYVASIQNQTNQMVQTAAQKLGIKTQQDMAAKARQDAITGNVIQAGATIVAAKAGAPAPKVDEDEDE